MDRKHPEIPYDHTEFQEVKVEKSKYTREAKHEKEPVDARSANGVAMSQVAAGLLGFGGLNRFSAHLLQSLLQAKMRKTTLHSSARTRTVSSTRLTKKKTRLMAM